MESSNKNMKREDSSSIHLIDIRHKHASCFKLERFLTVEFGYSFITCLKCIKTENGTRTASSTFLSSPKQRSTKLTVFPSYLVGWEGVERTEELQLILFLLPNVINQLVMFSSNNLICQALQLISHIWIGKTHHVSKNDIMTGNLVTDTEGRLCSSRV